MDGLLPVTRWHEEGISSNRWSIAQRWSKHSWWTNCLSLGRSLN